jgi:D-tyrosyl-tRNA(Tyr) deacylase
MLLLLGIADGDGEDDCVTLARKAAQLRIFEDPEGKMNLSVKQLDGHVTIVSQFTLVADTKKGNRPGFGQAMAPEPAEKLYECFVRELESHGVKVKLRTKS